MENERKQRATLRTRAPKKVRMFKFYVKHGLLSTFKTYGERFRDKEHLEKYLINSCKAYYDAEVKQNIIFKDDPDEYKINYNKIKLNGKQQSYWENENELIYIAPTINDLKGKEKQILNELHLSKHLKK